MWASTHAAPARQSPQLEMCVSCHDCRSEAYTCWSTASSARVNNYGARIDFILLGPPKAHCAADDARDKAQSGGWPAPGAAAAAEQCTAGSGMHPQQLLGCVTACDIWQDAQVRCS